MAPLIHARNIVGSPGSTFAGLAAMAPGIAAEMGNFHIPTTLAQWLQLAFGILALLAKA